MSTIVSRIEYTIKSFDRKFYVYRNGELVRSSVNHRALPFATRRDAREEIKRQKSSDKSALTRLGVKYPVKQKSKVVILIDQAAE